MAADELRRMGCGEQSACRIQPAPARAVPLRHGARSQPAFPNGLQIGG
ncbi:hypothetical protein OKW30_001441 [Paraburkholderia sp. Clong3]|nr:hypothetical protein [Paraburkholderia sp. CI2]